MLEPDRVWRVWREGVTGTIFHRISGKVRHEYLTRLGGVARRLKSPSLPNNPDGKVLIHVGCGELNDTRYINVDARPMPHIHYVSNDLMLNQFSRGSVDLIYACHVLEHVPHRELPGILANWFLRLKPGGILRLSLPDFDRIIEIYVDQGREIETIQPALMGGQEYDFNFHFSVFNSAYLSKLLRECGFREVREWDPCTAPYHSFDDWSKIPFIVNGKEYKISLNIEALR